MPNLTPEGKPAGSIDRTMLLAMWTHQLVKENNLTRPTIISAGMGKPTFPISQFATQAGIDYWNQASSKSQRARHILSDNDGESKAHNRIAKIWAAIDYGDPRGDLEPRTKVAAALTRWYGNQVLVRPEDVLYTVGGAGALYCIFSIINKRVPDGIMVTPFPHYALYVGPQGKNRLFSIPVMKEQGYRLTAKSLAKALEAATIEAKKKGTKLSTFLLCDPNNPLGTALEEDELKKIAKVLKHYPDLFIILDEAYAEMRLKGKFSVSLLSVAPELKDRIILMRSATKALSAAGERMAVTVAFNEDLRRDLLQENVNMYGHAPRSLQYIFAEALESLDRIELEKLRRYYKEQVEYVSNRLSEMGANMPDPHYKTEGTFYVLADLSDLLGQQIPDEASRALGKKGKITTDEDLIYSMLFEEGISITPLSYFGTSEHHGYVRITCSGGQTEQAELLNRIDRRLILARKEKQIQLESQLEEIFTKLHVNNPSKTAELTHLRKQTLMYQADKRNINALALKKSNEVLKKILFQAQTLIRQHSPVSSEIKAAINIQRFFRSQQKIKMKKVELDTAWRKCVDEHFDSKKTRSIFYNYSPIKRLEFKPWKEYLEKNNLANTPSEIKEEDKPKNPSPSHSKL